MQLGLEWVPRSAAVVLCWQGASQGYAEWVADVPMLYCDSIDIFQCWTAPLFSCCGQFASVVCGLAALDGERNNVAVSCTSPVIRACGLSCAF